jgi:hypothetical protein
MAAASVGEEDSRWIAECKYELTHKLEDHNNNVVVYLLMELTANE